MTEYDFKPFIHYVEYDIYQVCYLDDRNRLCATTYRGRHAEKCAREDLAKILEEIAKRSRKGGNGAENA